MKVLFVCSGNAAYGMAPFVQSQGTSLVRLGVDLDYFQVRGKGAVGYLRNVAPLARRISAQRYDLLHAHYSFSGLITVLANRRRLPLIASMMGGDVDGIVNERGQQLPVGTLNIVTARIVCRSADRVIVKSRSLLDHVPERWQHKAVIVPNGVDLDLFRPRDRTECRHELALDLPTRYVLFLGNPTELRKRYDLACEACAIVQTSLPETKLVAPYRIEHEKVPLFLNAADVMLLCSSSEGSPNVVKEALACNVPVVSTSVGDASDLLRGASNCLIAQANPQAIAAALLDVLRRGGRSNGRSVVEGMSLERVATRIVALYREVLDAR